MATRLLDEMRDLMRRHHYSIHTDRAYRDWVRRYARFHNMQSRDDLRPGEEKIEAFLTYLARDRQVAASTQNQAMNALVFLYKHVLKQPLSGEINADRARRKVKIPVVLTREETARVIVLMPGVHQLKVIHEQDVEEGHGQVYLPHALARKYPHADKDWRWQYVFPAGHRSIDPRSGQARRHHLDPSPTNKAIAKAIRQTGIDKRVSAHTFRHSFATHLLQRGTGTRTIRALLGHTHVSTTMIYTHVLQQGGHGVRSPLDDLAIGY